MHQDTARQSTVHQDTACQGTMHQDAAAMIYAFQTRSVMAIALWMQRVFWTQGVQADGIRMTYAVATHVQMQLSRCNVSRRSCEGTTCPDAAAATYTFWMRSVMAFVLWMLHVSSGRRVSRQMASRRCIPWHHMSKHSCRGTACSDAAAKAQYIQSQLPRYMPSRRGVSWQLRPGHSACLTDAGCQGRWYLDRAGHGTTCPDAAVKVTAFRPSCRGTEYHSETFNHICNLGYKHLVVLGVVTQLYSLYLIYSYIRNLRAPSMSTQHKHPA